MSSSRPKTGVLLAALAVLAWSTGGAIMYWLGQELSVWQILAIICGIAGFLQTVFYTATGRKLRDVLLPPALLWIPLLGGFVVTELGYTTAVTSASAPQVVGVNLVNYLWPTLTVVLAAWWVPGTRLTPKLLAALALALAGLVAANWQAIVQWSGGSRGAFSPWPYAVAAAGALGWAFYSALLARWNGWAQKHTTTPSGFIVVCLIALCVCLATGQWKPIPLKLWAPLLLSGVANQALGYMFWEMAVHRASPSVLGLLGSATPLLSTTWLLVILALGAGGRPPGATECLRLAFAGLLLAAAIAVNSLGSRPQASGDPPGVDTE